MIPSRRWWVDVLTHRELSRELRSASDSVPWPSDPQQLLVSTGVWGVSSKGW